ARVHRWLLRVQAAPASFCPRLFREDPGAPLRLQCTHLPRQILARRADAGVANQAFHFATHICDRVDAAAVKLCRIVPEFCDNRRPSKRSGGSCNQEKSLSIEIVEREIGRFLASPEPEVLCLKGKWGIGKTFAWQRFVQNAKSHGGIALDQYAFVSLFGVNSAEQLCLSIVESAVPRDRIGDDFD